MHAVPGPSFIPIPSAPSVGPRQCAAHGIYTIIDLHAAAGGQNTDWHSDAGTCSPLFLAGVLIDGCARRNAQGVVLGV
jgi:hypothetical protein